MNSIILFFLNLLTVYADNLLFAREFLNGADIALGWTFSIKQQCSGQLIEANKMVYMLDFTRPLTAKLFTGLPKHYRAELRVDFIIVDTANQDTVTFKADSTVLGSHYYDGNGLALKICGDPTILDRFQRVQYTFAHTASTLTITISHNMNSPTQLGITDLQIFLDTCHSSCSKCNGPNYDNCTQCAVGQTLASGKCVCPSGQYMQNGNCVSSCSAPEMASSTEKICVFDPCQSYCDQCDTSKRQCTKCNSSRKILQGVCVLSCPSYTTNIGGICVDMLTKYWNGMYIFKGFFETDFSSFSINQYGFNTNFFDPEGVIVASNWATYSDCMGYRFFGGFGIYGKTTTISRSWSIPWKHSSVLVRFFFAQIENYETVPSTGEQEKLSININGEVQASLISGGTEMGCGRLDQGESFGWLEANSTKTVIDQRIDLTITNNFNDPAWYEGFAFREMMIIVAKVIFSL